ncbi:ribonuclease III [Candidatus Roizmanbacteria bacterium RIFCSPLOWO2_01_FULL_44_13]|uniref:Ribonuclease 3 n=1 Tax=Candidatus Roizmanbacteria bacterium RIFCSPLOWO2_01_FULL_44_13 TaxID=1802069 RepID=A0A1F7JCN7_9BACT|nr:MAG: ribonuclease III [Candidatus Roizmanbacteria bacterium RIFCSPLOWO2_01_FULL_44_13]
MNPYQNLEKKIGVNFKSKNLLTNVFIHRSYLNEHKKFPLPSNERLEFLGDSVLSLITSVYLFKNYSSLKEGDYTEIKSAMVKTESLHEAAKNLGLSQYLLLSRGEENGRGRQNKNILADCLEALIGAIFLDHSFEASYKFVSKFLFEKKLDFIVKNELYASAKSQLQEIIQGKYKTTPLYRVIEEKGPEHKRIFKIAVYFKNKRLGTGVAGSKKEAEEKAAQNAFDNIKGL